MKKVGIYQDRRKQRPWVVRWFGLPDMTTGKRKRYSRSFATEADAQKFQAQQVIAFLDGRPRDRAEEVTLRQFCSDWLRTKRKSVRPGTFRDYKRLVGRLIEHFGPDILLRQIATHSAYQFYAALKPQVGETLSDWTRNKILRYCRAMFADAVEWELLGHNPFRKVKAKRQTLRGWHYLDAEQYRALLEAAPSLRWKALYALAYTCGLRFAELLNLRWQDIDFEQGKLAVKNRPATEFLPPFETKNGKDRPIPVPAHTIAILCQWRLLQGRKRVPYVLLTRRQYENVLARWQSYRAKKRPWENQAMTNNVQREFRQHIRKAGIEPTGTLTLHTLRKCAGKNWADRIRNPRVVQELMGHESLSTTMKFYSSINSDDMKKAASGIDDFLTQSDAKLTPDAAFA